MVKEEKLLVVVGIAEELLGLTMYSFYLCTLIIIGLILIGGFENTMRLFDFINISVKYLYVRTKSWFLLIKIQKDLGVEPTTLLNFLTEDNK